MKFVPIERRVSLYIRGEGIHDLMNDQGDARIGHVRYFVAHRQRCRPNAYQMSGKVGRLCCSERRFERHRRVSVYCHRDGGTKMYGVLQDALVDVVVY